MCIFDIARGLIDVGRAVCADLVAEDIAIFIITIEPKVGRLEILFVSEFTLDL